MPESIPKGKEILDKSLQSVHDFLNVLSIISAQKALHLNGKIRDEETIDNPKNTRQAVEPCSAEVSGLGSLSKSAF